MVEVAGHAMYSSSAYKEKFEQSTSMLLDILKHVNDVEDARAHMRRYVRSRESTAQKREDLTLAQRVRVRNSGRVLREILKAQSEARAGFPHPPKLTVGAGSRFL